MTNIMDILNLFLNKFCKNNSNVDKEFEQLYSKLNNVLYHMSLLLKKESVDIKEDEINDLIEVLKILIKESDYILSIVEQPLPYDDGKPYPLMTTDEFNRYRLLCNISFTSETIINILYDIIDERNITYYNNNIYLINNI